MTPLHVMVVMGTRPEAIKLAPIILDLGRHPAGFRVSVVATAQHREMLDQVLNLFAITPDRDLDIMRPGQTLTEITVRSLQGLESVMTELKPELVVLQGDTTTVFTGGLAAYYARLPVGHVEAGLRTSDKYRPYPEEINRRLAGVLTDLHFAPTPGARSNLLREGVSAQSIFVTGNPVIDALHWVADQPEPEGSADLEWVRERGGRLILVTAHRRESWGEPLREVCRALRDLVEQFPEVHVLYAVHRNPLVRQVAEQELSNLERVRLADPPDYRLFVALMKRSYLILTDSGGVQEEAPALGVPVVVLREVTERPEAVTAGSVLLAGTDRARIVELAGKILSDRTEWKRMSQAINPYGDGRAARRIREAILFHFGRRPNRPDTFGGTSDD